MNQDAIVVALDFIKGQILELKTDIKAISSSQRSLEEEIRKGYVTKEQFDEMKKEISDLKKDNSELKISVVKITTSISTVIGLAVWIIEHFFIK